MPNGAPSSQILVGAFVGVALLILGGLGTLILWNITQLSSKVEAIQVLLYETKSGLKTAQDRQEEMIKQMAEQKGTLDTALGKTRR